MCQHIELVDCNVFIPKTSFESACTHLKNIGFLNDTHHMSGCRYIRDDYEYWYLGMDMKDLANAIETNDLPKVFECFGFVVILNANGDIYDLAYNNDVGDEEHLCRTLASFFREGDYMQWRMEDGDMWRDVFSDNKIDIYTPTTVWSKA